MSEKKLNLHQKLVEIRKSVEYLKREAAGHRWSYTKESQVISAIRPQMDALNVLLEVDMMRPEQADGVITVGFEFTWVDADNPNDKITKCIFLQESSGDPKKIGGLLTYACRYHLMKTFQIASDDLDIDRYQEKLEKSKPSMTITQDQLEELESIAVDYEDVMRDLVKFLPDHNLKHLKAPRFDSFKKELVRRIEMKKEVI